MIGTFIGKKFYWNAEANVGPGCPNKIEDVQLVQLGYLSMGMNPQSGITAEEKAVYMAVVPGSHYIGAANDPLTIAIKFHQKKRGGTQDGVVSSIKSSTGVYAAKTTWILVPLNNNIADVLGDSWPRLDKHKNCPPALSAASIAILTPIAA